VIQRGGLTIRLIERGGIEQFVGEHSMGPIKADGSIATTPAVAGTMAGLGAVDFSALETVSAIAGPMASLGAVDFSEIVTTPAVGGTMETDV